MSEFTRSIEVKKEEAKAIAQIIGGWWKEVSKESQSAASPGKLYAVGNYVVELAKNSLSDGKSNGKVSVIFDEEKITIVVEDFGGEKELNLNVEGAYGLKEILEYADDFVIEANGIYYEKNRRGQLENVDDSDLAVGSRVTMIKFINKPPMEEEEEKYVAKRNFSERM